MSFREKCAWISMLSMSVIYGLYFWPIFWSKPRAAEFSFGGLLGTIIALVVVQIALTVTIAISTPKEANAPPDERDKLIELKAILVAYAGLSTGVVLACLLGAFDPPLVFIPNVLLFILVIAEITRSAAQIVQYRRGA